MKSTSYKAKQPDANGCIHYSPEEDAVWADLMAAQLPPIREHMSCCYLEGLQKLALPQRRIPQCQEINEKLLPLTGWRIEPVPALIGFEQFFGMLARCCFPAASFIRSREDFTYIEEPDIFHEVLGHTPLLTHPQLANFSRKIGEAGLQVPTEDHAWLMRLYWFTVEFGLIREGNAIKALGSGLASSVAELEHTRSGIPKLRPFDVMDILRTSYRIDIPQPVYFVINDLNDLLTIIDHDLAADIRTARAMGIFPPLYPPQEHMKAG